MHGQADDLFGHFCCHWQILAAGAGKAAVGREGADERVEVTTAQDAVVAKFEVELVARHAVLLGINKDGEVAVVVAHTGHVVPVGDAIDVAQGLAIADGDLMTGLDGLVDLTQVQQAVGRPHLVHLAVDAWCDDLGLAGKAEVLEVVDALLGLGIVHHQRAALDGVEHLGGMEAERAHVALVEDAAAVDLDTEGMGGVIDDTQAILVGNGLDLGGAARLAVDVHGHDGSGLGRDGGLDAVGVDAAGGGIDVDKHGPDAVPPDGVGGGDKAIGRGDDFAADAQCLQGGDQRQRAIGEQADVGYLEILAQGLLKPLVKAAVIGDPLAVPDFL